MTSILSRTIAATAACAALCVGMAAPASAAPTRDNNPNALDFTVTCPSGVIRGSGAPGGALIIEGGGVAVLQGLVVTETGEVVQKTNPGLSRRGVLEECTYVGPVTKTPFTVYVLLVP
jgi:hypothetical protein